jgi:hypothetical protein
MITKNEKKKKERKMVENTVGSFKNLPKYHRARKV